MERVGFVGAGRLGTALARALAAAGWPVVALASRTPASATRLARQLPGAHAVATAQEVAARADLVFLTVPDAAIAAVAEAVGWRPGQAVVHTSGADALAPLAAARRQGALVGCLHPLQTFAAPAADPLAPFAGVTCALDGDAALLPRLEAVVAALGARPLRVPPEARALYHASAALAANALVTLLHLAASLWKTFGIDERTATAALLPLARAAVENVATQGAGAALTGPIARGDAGTVARHRAALAATRPDLLPAYDALASATVALARAHGHLSAEAATALQQLLEGPPDPGPFAVDATSPVEPETPATSRP